MKIIEGAVRFPVTTAVCVILLALFGILALLRIPVQLTPDVEEPEITVSTVWPGASPQEIEREIVDEQEDQLKSLEGLVEMESSSSDSRGQVVLRFTTGTDIDTALLRVNNRLEQVPEYPPDADKPVIRSVDQNANAVGWFIIRPHPTAENRFEGDISHLFDFADDELKPEFERVEGVAAVNIYGGREREMQVVVDPAELAAREITLNELAAALDAENRNYSAGDFDEGKRRYIVRTVGEYTSPEDIEDIVITIRDGVPVRVRDVAHARLGYRKAGARVFQMGEQVLAMNAIREPGANVLDVMDGVKSVVSRLNQGRLADRGLEILQVSDQTEYIDSAIGLVQQSLVIGGVLAIVVLLLFLRSAMSTLVIAVAIPISVVGTFLLMSFFGRTLNVISLAGMAFAVGMVVDNSIVVLENIYRHLEKGKTKIQASVDGALEVWGAVLASTLTTIAVFVPVAFIEEEVGQLFGDIAIAVSCAVALSLIIALTVIPSLSAKVLRESTARRNVAAQQHAGGFARGVSGMVHSITGSWAKRALVIGLMTAASIGLAIGLMPETEYLPLGNQNFLFGFLLPPPGYNLDEVAEMQGAFAERLSGLWEADPDDPATAELPGGGVRNFFYVALPDRAFMGVRARDELRVRELIPEFRKANEALPGTIFVINQSSIFTRGIGEGRSIDVEITGPDLERLIALGGEVFGRVMQALPDAQARPIPSLDLGNPEVRVRTHRQRAAELGISNRQLGYAVNALIDGARASDYRYQGREIDLVVMGNEEALMRTHLLEQMPIATPEGELVTLGSVADVSLVDGPVQIDHKERQRAITIQVTPDERMPLERAMQIIRDDILGSMREEGRFGPLYAANLSGTADKLSTTASALKWNFLLALLITYLLMAALFENFVYPFVIMFSVPLAALGGILGLAVMNLFTFQALDVLTMLGFIILVGTVVNNAILIVHQSLNHMRHEGLEHREAIRESVRNRIRPIFMSVTTSVMGMLPLVLFPGAGSELYRGLGSVVVGGLILSTVFTLVLVPAVFSVMLDIRVAAETRLRRWFGLGPADDAEADAAS